MTNLTIYKAKDYPIPLTFTDSDGAAYDITDATVYFTVKDDLSDADVDAKIQVITTAHTDPGNGQTTIYITDIDSNIDVGNYYYDIQLTLSTGEKYHVECGRLTVKQPVTLT